MSHGYYCTVHFLADAGLGCAQNAREGLLNIQNPKAYTKELTALPDWRIGCIFTGKGPENLFEEFGFRRDRRIAKWRWVMQRRVQQ